MQRHNERSFGPAQRTNDSKTRKKFAVPLQHNTDIPRLLAPSANESEVRKYKYSFKNTHNGHSPNFMTSQLLNNVSNESERAVALCCAPRTLC